MNKDEVISHLQILWTWNELGITHAHDEAEKKERARTVEWIKDTLKLIEEQKPKHGKWLESKILEDCFWVCSECEFPSEAFAAPTLYKYCPNCGAKMDRR